MNANIRNRFTSPLTVQEQLAESDLSQLRLALLVQEVAAAMGKAVTAVNADDIFDYSGPDWPRPLPTLLTEGYDDGDL